MAKQMCQSCGMPLKTDADKGTEADGSLSQKYCVNCYQNGEYTWADATPEQMQTYCMGVLTKDMHWPSFVARQATKNIPKLERWRNYKPQHTARSMGSRHH